MVFLLSLYLNGYDRDKPLFSFKAIGLK